MKLTLPNGDQQPQPRSPSSTLVPAAVRPAADAEVPVPPDAAVQSHAEPPTAMQNEARWNGFLADAGSMLASGLDYERTLRRVVQLAVPAVADWCVLHVIDEHGTVTRAASAHALTEKDALAHELAERYPLDPAHPFTALRVLETRMSEFVPVIDLASLESHVRDAGELELLQRLSPHSEISVPLLVRGRLLGALNLIVTEPTRASYGPADVRRAEELARFAAFAMDNAELYRAAQREIAERRRAEEQARFLMQISTTLASSLDYHETLQSAVRLAVPLLADWCHLDVLEADGRIHRVALAHGDSSDMETLLRCTREHDSAADSPSCPAAQVLRSGTSLRVDAVDEMLLGTLVPTDGGAAAGQQLAMLRSLGPCTLLAVPLVARGRTVGAVTLLRGQQRDLELRRADDLPLAEELARRAALAIDNARLYESALAASQAKSDFLAVMSHELRTPLTTVIGYAELLVDEVSGPVSEQQRQQLTRIQASAGQLLQLIEEILAFSSVDAGREPVRRERVDVARLTHDAALLVEPTMHGRALRFVERIPDAGVFADTDASKVRQIVVNLLSNAVKFTERGEIGVSVACDERWVTLDVWDTGIGIEPCHLLHIFDPFWQVEHPASRRTGGTGLGLSVTRHLARLLGGDVRVESTLGCGSRFRVQLPATSAAAT